MLLFSNRISSKQLAELSRRMAISLGAGVDLRRTLARETENSRGALHLRLATVSDAASRGRSLTEGFSATGDYFPGLFRQLVEVGEQTGHTAEVFGQLAEHYEHQVALRRSFISSITWPLIQLGMAITVIGLLIWIMGWLDARGATADILGWGLKGTRGLAIYLLIIGSIAAGVGLAIHAARRGALWTKPIQRFLLRLPGLGRALRTIALARLSWALHVTLNTGMEVRRAVRVALFNSGSVRFEDAAEPMLATISQGRPIHEAMRESRAFPGGYIDAVAVGEESGRLVETLALLSRQQQEEARSAMAVLVRLAGFAVWCIVAAVLIVMIFRLAGFYLGAINDAANIR
jgi:type II secretory pathway component PulF